MRNLTKNHNSDLNQQADEIVALLDSLVNSGSQHINLNIGEETKIQTVNSTDCSSKLGACAIPNFEEDDEDEEF
ncbi:MAG: hypothetical protein K2K06_10425 [Oscillospiraceae bacterium]|nr:hypothetical protein [Ruminococcus sp.]MDE6708434.1 hypothetical protein [Oscillospiraceae bacterium]